MTFTVTVIDTNGAVGRRAGKRDGRSDERERRDLHVHGVGVRHGGHERRGELHARERRDVPARADDGELQRRPTRTATPASSSFTVTVADTDGAERHRAGECDGRGDQRGRRDLHVHGVGDGRALTATDGDAARRRAVRRSHFGRDDRELLGDRHARQPAARRSFTVDGDRHHRPGRDACRRMRRSKRRARPARSFTFTASATDVLDGAMATTCTPAERIDASRSGRRRSPARRPTRTATQRERIVHGDGRRHDGPSIIGAGERDRRSDERGRRGRTPSRRRRLTSSTAAIATTLHAGERIDVRVRRRRR